MPIPEHSHPTNYETPEKPEFKLPEGYVLGWKETFVDGKKVGWHALRNAMGEELGLFEFIPGESVEVILNAHLNIEIVKTREKTKAVIILRDSYEKEIGKCERHKNAKDQWEYDHNTKDPIKIVVEYLANRQLL